MRNSAPVKLRTTWAELFAKEMPGEERRQRWEAWKKMAIAAGDKELVEYWQDPRVCIGCVALLDDCWCDRVDLPCTVNPYLMEEITMRKKYSGRVAAKKRGKVVLKRTDRETGAWIAYQMKLQGFTFTSIAERVGCSVAMVHMVVYGRKTSGRVRKGIALILGADSWGELIASRTGRAA